MSDAAFYLSIVLLVALFVGGTDLMDAIQNYLNSAGCRR